MGEIKSMACNDVPTIIWEWCTNQISGSLLAISQGTKMVRSWTHTESTEWSLPQDHLKAINRRWGSFDMDLFASRLNFKVP